MENLFSIFVAYIQEVIVGLIVLLAFAAVAISIYKRGSK